MTPKQQELRRLLNLTVEGDEYLEKTFRAGADAVGVAWSNENIHYLANGLVGYFAESVAWTRRVIMARDAVIDELNNQ